MLHFEKKIVSPSLLNALILINELLHKLRGRHTPRICSYYTTSTINPVEDHNHAYIPVFS
jgi:hypothetical protein